jgi:preprotein translocase subunit SecA
VSYSAPGDPSTTGGAASMAAAARAGGGGAATAEAPADNGNGRGAKEPVSNTPVVKSDWDKTPRNAPCPCGSGKKFKLCHGK